MRIKTYGNNTEMDYYEEILQFFEKIERDPVARDKIEKWSDYSYITLMHEIKKHKKLQDADIRDVAKNSIILILNLIDGKCQLDTSTDLEKLSPEEREFILNTLKKALE